MNPNGDQRTWIGSYAAAILIHLLVFGLWHAFADDTLWTASASDPDSDMHSPPEIELTFVEVPSPDTKVPNPDAPFYSDRDSQAASDAPTPEPSPLSLVEGQEQEILRLVRSDLLDSLESQMTPDSQEATETEPQEQPEVEPQETTVTEAQEPSDETEESPAPEESVPPPPIQVVSPMLPEESPDSLVEQESTEEEARIQPLPQSDPVVTPPDRWQPVFNQAQKSETSQETTTPPKPSSRPRSLSEARKRNQLVGEVTKVESLSDNLCCTGMVDAQNKSFGDYDLRLQVAIQNAWYRIVNSLVIGTTERGTVIIKFRLLENGSVEPTTVDRTSVGLLLTAACQDAIEGAAPFGAWPQKMREEIGKPSRDITFTFGYR
ncbi:MAG: hypothetical protein LR011_06250 [Verrucomicrobia bacterium]|nr:hypothetical protein [Verrucomicrobiota bacterium]